MRITTLFCLLCYPFLVIAGVIPENSRIIFHAKNALQSSVLVNTNPYPVVAQLWVDEGELNTDPEQAVSPFVVTPVISRMDPLKINEMKLIFSGEKNSLPADRESLFWLNILEVPPVNKNPATENEVTLSMLTQVKILYRPESLETNSHELLAKLDALTFSAKKVNKNVLALTVNNPTQYVASLAAVSLLSQSGGSTVRSNPTGTPNFTLLPKSTNTFQFEHIQPSAGIDEIEYFLIDDSGKFFQRRQHVSVSQ